VFAHEPALSTWLAALSPGSVPVVHAALQPEQGWLLLCAAGGTPLDVQPNLERWSKALRQYAELQVATVSHAAALRSIGLPDRRGPWLDDGLDHLLADEAALLVNQPGGLSSEEVARLRGHATELHQRCVELAACGIPAALEHGDFGPWQVLAESVSSEMVLSGGRRLSSAPHGIPMLAPWRAAGAAPGSPRSAPPPARNAPPPAA
jgi:hypothetical protein